jgi:multidrug efflux system membrane fusion protein
LIKAPFDGKVLRQMVDLGQVVNRSQAIAEIYSTAEMEIRLPIKANDLDNIVLPASGSYEDFNDSNPELVNFPKVLLEAELGRFTYQWTAELIRSEGAFDAETRMLYLVARIKKPFESTAHQPGLRVGQFLRAKIQGRELKQVYVIPRRAVTQNDFIAIAEEGLLKKRKITPIWTDSQSVVVVAGDTNQVPRYEIDAQNFDTLPVLSENDLLILTPTANLVNGTRVKSILGPATNGMSIGQTAENKTNSQTSGLRANKSASPPSSNDTNN